jgi:hypothetical protein
VSFQRAFPVVCAAVLASTSLSAQVPGTYPTYRLRFTAGPSPFPIYHYALQQEHDALVGMGWGSVLMPDPFGPRNRNQSPAVD